MRDLDEFARFAFLEVGTATCFPLGEPLIEMLWLKPQRHVTRRHATAVDGRPASLHGPELAHREEMRRPVIHVLRENRTEVRMFRQAGVKISQQKIQFRASTETFIERCFNHTVGKIPRAGP